MRTIKLIVSIVTAGFLISLPLAYGNDAPIEDLSAAGQQQSTGPATVNSMDSSDTQYDTQQKERAQQAAMDKADQTQASELSAGSTMNEDDDAGTSNVTGNNKERLERLEQQVSNMTNMNLPQQIEGLRQEVQQLNGRLQVQQHDIKVLENQQRSFYQDLNRRIQQISNSGAVPVSQKQQKQSAKPMVVSAKLKDSGAYRSAFNLLVKKKYDDALAAFQSYIRQYPNGAFVANAYYWMGELYLKKNDIRMAAQSFMRITSKYPTSNKVPDAKLKLAIIHISQGKAAQARREFQLIKRRYPNSTAAQLATIQLQRMAQ